MGIDKKVALYCRVSTLMQSTENQRFILEKFANERGWGYDLFEENESTRKTRPVKAELLNKLRNGVYAGVVVLKLDRWARSSNELILEIDELTKKKIFFLSVNDNLDFSTATGILHFQILAAFAQFERSLVSLRTRESLQRIKESGIKKLGRPEGSKDKKARKKSGYILKEARKRKTKDEEYGIFKSIEDYLNARANNRPTN